MRTWWRTWRRNRRLAVQYVLTIAVGMGSVAAVLSLMLALAFQPLPFREPERLVVVWERAQSDAAVAAISGPDLADFASATGDVFTGLGAFSSPTFWLLDDRRGGEQIVACYLEEEAFRALGIVPVLGRAVRAGDLPAGTAATAPVWISYRLWQSRYGGSPSVIGTTIRLAQSEAGLFEKPYEVAGVMPPGVSMPHPSGTESTDVWFIMSGDLKRRRPRDAALFFAVGRLRPGVGVAQAQAALTAVADRLGQHDLVARRKRPVVQALQAMAQEPARRTMGLLTLGAGLVFLLGFANLAILIVTEGSRRRREIAIRAALGAGRLRLWSEAAAEHCLLTLVSLGLGVLFASALLRELARLLPAAGLGPPLAHVPPLSVGVLLGFAVFALAAALLWAALLVAAAEGREPARALSTGGWLDGAGLGDSDRRSGRWRLVLLASQAGLGVCLVTAAVLATRTYATLSIATLGPDPRHTVLLSVEPRENVAFSDDQAEEFNRQMVSRLEQVPGAQAIAFASLFPPMTSLVLFAKQGEAADAAREASPPTAVSDNYFRTLGIAILFGRGFDRRDRRDGEAVAIVSLDLAERNWHTPQDAVGAEIVLGSRSRYRIVGVAANFTGYWARTPLPTIYEPLTQSPSARGEFIVRTAGRPDAFVGLARDALRGTTIPALISDASTMQARWQATLTRPQARMFCMSLLALLGLALSIQGAYAVAAATLAARRHELAVRSALGAHPGRLAWNVTRELVLAAVSGAALGVAAAAGLQPILEQWLGPLAHGRMEPIAVAIVLLALAAATGCYVPARAAARANPVDELRRG